MTGNDDGIVLERPDVWKSGSHWKVEWPQSQVRATCRNIREHSDSLTSEITWEFQAGTGGWVTLYRSQMNLNAPGTRSTVAKELAARADWSFNWRAAVDQLCILVPDSWRAGEPIVMLHDVVTPEEPQFLVDRFLPQGVTTVLYGDGQAGKSIVGLSLALAVANGQPFGGRWKVKSAGPVLYLDWETSKEDHAFREKRLWASGQYGEERAHPVYYGRMNGSLAEQVERIQDFVTERNIILVVYDSLGWATGDELKEAGPAIRVMDASRQIGGTSLFLAHITKQESRQRGKEGPASIFGSKFFELAARYTWEMSATQDELDGSKALTLRNRKANGVRRSEPMAFRMEFETDRGPITLMDQDAANDPAGPGSLGARLIVALRQGAKDTQELMAMTGTTDNVIRKVLGRLEAREQVRKVGESGPGRPQRWGLAAPEYAGVQPSFVAPKAPDQADEAVAQEDPETAPVDPLEGVPDDEVCAMCRGARADRYTPAGLFICPSCGDQVQEAMA